MVCSRKLETTTTQPINFLRRSPFDKVTVVAKVCLAVWKVIFFVIFRNCSLLHCRIVAVLSFYNHSYLSDVAIHFNRKYIYPGLQAS
jgi:hypothetical protein